MAKKRKPGQRPIVDARMRAKLLRDIKSGLTLHDACDEAGIHYNTLLNERQRNKEFDREVRKAKRDGLRAAKRTLYRAAKKDWKAAAHLLAVRDPDNWSKTRKIAVSKVSLNVNVDLNERRMRLAAIAAKLGIDGVLGSAAEGEAGPIDAAVVEHEAAGGASQGITGPVRGGRLEEPGPPMADGEASQGPGS